MGRIIRRTVTITITETWTIVWVREDEPQQQATTLVQDPPKTQKEPDAALQATLIDAEPGQPRTSDRTPLPRTPATALAPQPDGVSTHPATSGSRRTCHRRQAGSTQRSD